MDQHELDTLLEDQNRIEDINFTSTVIKNIHKVSFLRKMRFYLPFAMMGIGVLLSMIIFPSEKLLYFFEMGFYEGISSQLTVLGVLLCLLLPLLGLSSIANEELR